MKNEKHKVNTKSNLVQKDILISKLIELHPEVVEMLVTEWGFHCVNCIISNFETLEQGAQTHGITGIDFEVMMEMINDIVKAKIDKNNN